MPFPLHVNDDLELRVLRVGDADRLYALVDQNRDHLKGWFPWVAATSSAAPVRSFIERGLERLEIQLGVEAGIWHRDDLSGVVGLHRLDHENRSASIGYWLSQLAEGHGLMTASVRTLATYCFSELALHRLEIRCAVHNRRSRAVAERLGFQFEGILRGAERHGDHYYDLAVYGGLAPEWDRTQSS